MQPGCGDEEHYIYCYAVYEKGRYHRMFVQQNQETGEKFMVDKINHKSLSRNNHQKNI